MKSIFDEVSIRCSEMITRRYSTSFSLGIKFLDKQHHKPVYAIYGFVRLADEIVDSFHDYNKEVLLDRFKRDTYLAIREKISLNPVLNAFQEVVNAYKIPLDLLESFLQSMEMDLADEQYNRSRYEQYILGSAESVGLMCLQVFVDGNPGAYEQLKGPAMKLGAAFQKVNFLRDIRADYYSLQRSYFPGLNPENFLDVDKKRIELEIESDFNAALSGIKALPASVRKGVYLAYYYYLDLFRKIKNASSSDLMSKRIRISNGRKIYLMLQSITTRRIG
ncbi:phytoene/squalene synthase family protein [Pedobacter aquatilis]|uniref:phytoene/squalene synthase family protein n=1 Tax=Pedobacter aquatilis TaxID=351343 RepID=UPI00292F3904|nr:squalene/phytoene synthase family protein [Pedobacter aquatilis]